jgi:hypothetical protein
MVLTFSFITALPGEGFLICKYQSSEQRRNVRAVRRVGFSSSGLKFINPSVAV